MPVGLVVTAGNVILLLAAEPSRWCWLRSRTGCGLGLLVSGFGLDAAHPPLPDAPVDLPSYDRWCALSGLELVERFAGWDGAWYRDGGYAVSVHRRVGAR